MRLRHSSSGLSAALVSSFSAHLLALVAPPPARADSSYVAQVYQPFNPIARDEGPFGASVGAVSPIEAWSAQAEIDADLGSARATTVGCEFPAGFQQVCNGITASADGSDYIRLIPSTSFPAGTPVDVVFYLFLDGSIDGIGAWSASGSLSVYGNNPFSPIVSLGESHSTGGVPVFATQASYSGSASATTTLSVGQTYWMVTSINASSAVRTCPTGSDSCDLPLGIDVDFSDGSAITVRPLHGGYGSLQLVGDSGRDYLVPLPEQEMAGAGWLLGLVGMRMAAAARRGRRSRSSST